MEGGRESWRPFMRSFSVGAFTWSAGGSESAMNICFSSDFIESSKPAKSGRWSSSRSISSPKEPSNSGMEVWDADACPPDGIVLSASTNVFHELADRMGGSAAWRVTLRELAAQHSGIARL